MGPGEPLVELQGLGEACALNEDCEVGELPDSSLCITGNDARPWIGGYCSANFCTNSDQCGENGTCGRFGDGVENQFCLLDCEDRGDCRANYACVPLNEVISVCLPECRNDDDCNEGSTCGDEGFCE